MKRIWKKVSAALLAALLMFSMQMIFFAEVESSDPSEPVSSESSSEGESQASGEVDEDGFLIDDATEPADGGALSEAPDTGLPIVPIVVAVIAVACIPIILKTRK